MECKENTNQFWKYVQARVKNVSGKSPLKMQNGELAIDDTEKANTLNDFFASVFTRENYTNMPHCDEGERSNGVTISEIRVTPASVSNIYLLN